MTLLYSFLKEKKHNVKINSSNLLIISNLQQFTNNTFRCITKINFRSNPVWYIPQWPIFWFKWSELHNFANDNTISATCKRSQQRTDTFKQESECSVLWFTKNEMIVTSKMERFVIIVNGSKPLTIITKRSILDVAAALDLSLS